MPDRVVHDLRIQATKERKSVPSPVSEFIDQIKSLCHIAWIDTVEIHDVAAGLSHGLGIPGIDSLILAGFILNSVETIYTSDAHLGKYIKKGVQVIKL